MREDERQAMLANSLNHLVRRMITNADTLHASKIFLEAREGRGLLSMVEPAVIGQFLDRLLPELEKLDRLPPKLVPLMIIEFGWPRTHQELAERTTLRPDVRAMIERHARDNWVVSEDSPLVDKDAKQLWTRHANLGFVLALVILLLVIGGKLLFRWGKWSSSF
jgi:hypothetical protein